MFCVSNNARLLYQTDSITIDKEKNRLVRGRSVEMKLDRSSTTERCNNKPVLEKKHSL